MPWIGLGVGHLDDATEAIKQTLDTGYRSGT